MTRPNIILIMTDQMRGDAMGCDGNTSVQTPNLDYMAARGSRFNHAYSAVPSCLPARAILWTGMDQWHAGVLGMGGGQGHIPNDFPYTLAGELTNAGYRTHRIGKGHFEPERAEMGFETAELDESGRMTPKGEDDDYRLWFRQHAPEDVSPDDHGVDWNSWLARPWHTDEHLHPTVWTMTRALHFLRGRPMDRPFFLHISFSRPHSPYVPPRPYWDMYYDGQTPPPSVGDWASVHDRPEQAVSPNAWRGRMTPQQIHRARSGYYGEVSFIDTQIGRLMNWLHRFQGEASRNTWFLFTSDHGDMQGDHNLWRKTYAYEGSTRIPFLVASAPTARMHCRGVSPEPVELRDIMPTVLEIAGLPCPPTVVGKSVLPLLRGQADGWRQYIHGEHSTCYAPEQEMQYVTDGLEKFIWLPRIGAEQFFDLTKDPGECRDLIGNPAWQPRIALWRQRLVDELTARQCGWAEGKKLIPPQPGINLVSPFKNVRWQGRE